MTGPVVSVVVVTWNGVDVLGECLDSLRRQSLAPDAYRVVVVDNASTDGTAALMAARFPDVVVVPSTVNLGFAAGANLGIRATDTPYVVVLNNDAEADRDLLRCLVRVLDGDSSVAAVTAKVLLTGTQVLNSTGNLMSRAGRGMDRDWLAPDVGRAAGDVFGFCGAAAALRRAALEEVGDFDEFLFLYYEDTDLSWRFRAAGWTVRYEPGAVAEHRHGVSSQVGSPLFTYWNERNSLVVFTRHAPLALVVVAHLRRAMGLVLHSVRAPRSPVTAARWRALAAHLRRLPVTLSERRTVWATAKVPRSEVARLLVPSAT